MSDISQQEYQRRRQALLAQMQPGSAALIFAAQEATRSADSEYPYRQSSDFWYFTGFNEPEAVLVLIKSDDTHNHSVLFNRVRDLTAEIWFGRRLGQDAAPEKLGVDRALAFSEINQQLYQLLNGLDVVYHAQGEYAYADEIVFAALDKLRKGSRQNLTAPATMTDWRPMVHEMRLFKSPEEITVMRRAGEISALAHTRAMKKCRPGMFEYQLEGEIHHEFNRHGARYPSYNTIVGSGENGCILHYTENESEMRDGDLVLIDAGCEYKGYAGDITRTFPVNGKFTPAQREIYDIVLASLETSLRLFRPGTSIQEVTGEVVRIMIAGLVNLGILQGDVEQLIAENAHRPFFMHGLSHWLGLDVHDVGVYGQDRSRVLEPGMVLTVEPGLYIAPDADVPEAYRGIGIRIEDDIVITETGNENLTASVVKKADDIEALMAAARQL
ncbi:Xaa-Pro aminopeptidase [Citrobacter koseri]|uniref:Xaa-Pro aminopeptidase n=1 Tax=Citrobacter koseri TaxID=545 RepID=UPI0023B28623|nr:Xaa-Pro aminopeptidase [Citrobacter koseri]MDE9579531.1 Xaa-Pro aminopeptidase [Citrobacter koseri]